MGAVLITGIAGGLAQRVARRLADRGREVVGVDYREVRPSSNLAGVTVHRASYNKTAVEDVFRRQPVDAVLHLGRVGNLTEDVDKRFELNVLGSQKIMQLCVSTGVRTLVVLSTFHIYGAHPRNHTPISEDDPLRAGTEFPQIADAIQLDNMAITWVYKHPAVRTVLLRPTNVVGPSIHNAMSSFLRAPRVPYVLGFNPMTQFVHEDDLADAVIASLDGDGRGVFNIGGAEVVPWRTALELVDARTLPIPSALVTGYLKVFSDFPGYLLNFFKYPCVVTDGAYRSAFGWSPKIDIRETLETTVAQARRRQIAAARH